MGYVNPDPTKVYALCPICGMAADILSTGQRHIDCLRCGEYRLGDVALLGLGNPPLTRQQSATISGYIFENPDLQITSRNLDFLRALRPPSIGQRGLKLLGHLAKVQPTLGASIDLTGWQDIDKLLNAISKRDSDKMPGSLAQRLQPLAQLLGLTSSSDGRELSFLLAGYLEHQEHLIEVVETGGHITATITAKGWERLETTPQGESSIAFVAMWFDAGVLPVWEQALYPGIYDAGYTPFRIDKKEHLNKIDDEIIASIRAARFVVADFTGQRGGVYYEAGFAAGSGKPVIWTVKDEDLKGVHFDTRQYNHLVWNINKLDNFKAALKNRIEATLGHGPILPR